MANSDEITTGTAPASRVERRRIAAETHSSESSRGRRAQRPQRSSRSRATVIVGIFGELFVTAGILIFLFLFWQLWLNDIVVRAQQDEIAHARSQEWIEQAQADSHESESQSDAADSETSDEASRPSEPATPVVAPEQPDDAEIFGVMFIPRFGADYAADVAGGVTRPGTLDPIGLGHYLDTQLPGQPGNFAVAGHRTTYGKPLNQIASLRVGDSIVLQTKEGWYTYRFRTLEYVTPSSVDVLEPVPQQDTAEATDSYITLTACSPLYSAAERIIAYGAFESFTPTADGPPASITDPVED